MQTSCNNENRQWLILFFLLLGLVFLFHSYPMGLSDYWWHMNNGRWIWETGQIPSVDPFTYSYAKDDDIRRVVILRAYYLAQLSFFAVHSATGIWGLLLYKALLLTIPYALLLLWLKNRRVHPLFAFLLISPLPFVIFRLDELRPQIFSFIGAIAILYLAEKLLIRLKRSRPVGIYFLALPLTMLLWANVHRGFIIGWVILGAYLIGELLQSYLKRPALHGKPLKTLFAIVSLSILITVLNPNGADAFIANFVELKGPFMQVIDEFFPLWRYSKLYQSWHVFFACVAIVLFTGFYMLRHREKIQIAHIILFFGFAYEGFATFRFSHFLAFILLAIAATYFAEDSHRLFKRFKTTFMTIAIVSLLSLSGVALTRTAFVQGPLETAYIPQKAVEFIKKNRVDKNLFNAFEYGGYLSWALYPDYQIFIDQRNLDFSVYEEYGKAWSGKYEAVFDKYQVNSVLFYIRQPVLNRIPPLIVQLLRDSQWQLVYIDPLSLVFVRASSNTHMPVYDKNRVLNYIHKKSQQLP